jgi:hypothetical protein
MPKQNRRRNWKKLDLDNILAESPLAETQTHDANVFDASEFPSLGGGAQPQQQSAGPAPGASSYWANNIAARPRSPTDRSYGRGFGRGTRVRFIIRALGSSANCVLLGANTVRRCRIRLEFRARCRRVSFWTAIRSWPAVWSGSTTKR